MSNALLWQVISPKGVKSFLFGTMHVRDMHAFGTIDQVKECIQCTEVYYSELQMESNGMELLNQFHQLPDRQDLKYLMPHHKFNRLRKSILKSFSLDIEQLARFYPMIIANIIQTSVLNNASDVILDFYLYRYAREEGKELRFLESQEEQLSLFHQIPLEYQIKSLIHLGRQPAKAKKQILDLLKYYSENNTRQLYLQSKKQLGKMRHILLYRRNENMARLLVHDLGNTPTFVGVGAAHLFGYKGILRLMKKGGYRVKPWKRDH